MQDAAYLDRSPANDAIQKEVSSAPTVPSDVKNAGARHDLVASFRPRYVGAVHKLSHRTNDRIAINSGLLDAKIIGCPPENVCEVELCRNAELNAPFPLGHAVSFDSARNDLFREIMQIGL
jgi:hypothetical protein